MQRVTRQPSVLPWIVAFKAVKATVLTALGVMLLMAIPRDPVDFVVQIAMAVHLPLTSRLVDRGLTLAFRATPRKEEALAHLVSFVARVCKGSKAASYKSECEVAQTLVLRLERRGP